MRMRRWWTECNVYASVEVKRRWIMRYERDLLYSGIAKLIWLRFIVSEFDLEQVIKARLLCFYM
jgi:hypothetical protein